MRFSDLETISLQAEMKTALRQAIDQLYEEYVGIHLKAKKFIDSLSDWGAIMKDSSEVKHEKIAVDAMGAIMHLKPW